MLSFTEALQALIAEWKVRTPKEEILEALDVARIDVEEEPEDGDDEPDGA